MSGQPSHWMFQPFLSKTDSPEDEKQKKLVVALWVTLLVLSGSIALLGRSLPLHEFSEAEWTVMDRMTAYMAMVPLYCLVHLHQCGLTPFLKAFFIVSCLLWVTSASVVAPYSGAEVWYVLLSDLCLLLQTSQDRVLMHAASIVVRAGAVAYAFLHGLSELGIGPSIHPFGFDCLPLGKVVSCTVPMLLNFRMMRSYAASAQQEAHRVNEAEPVVTFIVSKLANFDLDGAEALLKDLPEAKEGDGSYPMHAPLLQILQNLRRYQPFLPSSLFCQTEVQAFDPPNEVIANAMMGEETCWDTVRSAVQRLRDPDYSLQAFGTDMQVAFPELKLYDDLSAEAERRCSTWSSGRTGSEERQRVMGAMYSIYCLARLDVDGKEIFSYGVDAQWFPRSRAEGAAAARRLEFYESMQWSKLIELFVRADLLVRDRNNKLQTNEHRMTALLVLTAVHDIMKNTSLLPTIQKRHAPYGGIPAGSVVNDHDVALAYIMEYFPSLLPSFQGLEPGQRAPILFSQGKIGFNNGWLVQGEAPPGALFTTFKRVIVHGRASEADISFYFAHWVTDLAGSELFDHEPWPGSEKFVLKFPRKVLVAFLDSFVFVDKLSSMSEVEVMEDYLQSRWLALGLRGTFLPEDCNLAAMRLVLMAQGFEAGAVKALLQLPKHLRDIIATEMARTGHSQQFASAPASVKSSVAGPALLVYYAPALVQTAGAAQVLGALQVLAAVYRAARELFPLKEGPAEEQTVVVRIDRLKVLTPSEIAKARWWHLKRTSDVDAEAVAGKPTRDARDAAGGEAPLVLEPPRPGSPSAGAAGQLRTSSWGSLMEGSSRSWSVTQWRPSCLPSAQRSSTTTRSSRAARPHGKLDVSMLLGHVPSVCQPAE